MKEVISIIVPVYNTKKFLHRCVESIICQTHKRWELLLVDDGSSDGSERLCDELAVLDSRIQVLHKKNGGVASARNTGIKYSNGAWIMFVDSDDFIKDENYLEQLLISSGKADIILSGFCYYFENGECVTCKNGENAFIGETDYRQYVSRNLNSFEFLVVWAKLFRKQIISDHDLRFNEQMIVGEDASFLHRYLLYGKCISVCRTKGYAFYQKAEKSKYKLSSLQASYHINKIISDLDALKEKRAIYNQLYYSYVPLYYCRLYAKYLYKGKLWLKEDTRRMNIITDNLYVRKA